MLELKRNYGRSVVHEIMIKAAKRAIFAILGSADLNDEELMTAFTNNNNNNNESLFDQKIKTHILCYNIN